MKYLQPRPAFLVHETVPADRPAQLEGLGMSGAMISEELTRCLKSVESTEVSVPVQSLDLSEAASCIPIHALPNPDTEPAAAAAWTQNISATLQAALKAVFGLQA